LKEFTFVLPYPPGEDETAFGGIGGSYDYDWRLMSASVVVDTVHLVSESDVVTVGGPLEMRDGQGGGPIGSGHPKRWRERKAAIIKASASDDMASVIVGVTGKAVEVHVKILGKNLNDTNTS